MNRGPQMSGKQLETTEVPPPSCDFAMSRRESARRESRLDAGRCPETPAGEGRGSMSPKIQMLTSGCQGRVRS